MIEATFHDLFEFDYKVITSFTLSELEKMVIQKLREGWTLEGGISIDGDGFFQAMMKIDDTKYLLMKEELKKTFSISGNLLSDDLLTKVKI